MSAGQLAAGSLAIERLEDERSMMQELPLDRQPDYVVTITTEGLGTAKSNFYWTPNGEIVQVDPHKPGTEPSHRGQSISWVRIVWLLVAFGSCVIAYIALIS